MATCVLVSGAWLGGWAWAGVSLRLRAMGHDAHPVTLTGLGEREHLATPGTDLETHITDVVNVIAYEGLSDVVLVGHSYSGIVVEGVADRLPDRVAAVVYVDSAPMGDGVAHLDFYPEQARDAVVATVEAEGDGWRLPFPGLESLAQQASVAGLGPDARRTMEARATAQPFATYTQPLRLEHARPTAVRGLVACSDGGFSVAQIRAALDAPDPGMFACYAGLGWRFDEIATGHWPMLSTPDDLAEVLAGYAR